MFFVVFGVQIIYLYARPGVGRVDKCVLTNIHTHVAHVAFVYVKENQITGLQFAGLNCSAFLVLLAGSPRQLYADFLVDIAHQS